MNALQKRTNGIIAQMSKLPFNFQMLMFLLIFTSVAIYLVGALETEDGKVLLVLIVVAGLISTARAAYLRNKKLKHSQK
jgi:hypothetical protein